ncbi:MAG: site-2 protease family protein [Sulfurovum sp.]|nr:site-2 protease family protein [Sulfurovum sp.]
MTELEIYKIAASILAIMVAIIGHEIMHGWVAYRYGDDTAKSQGRLSINPIVHIDPIGTLLVPALLYISGSPFLFGWAKPVPINSNIVIRNGGYNAMIAVSLAGITYNFLLAILLATILPLVGNPDSALSAFVYLFILQSILINVVLGVFNLWPVPPLDGSQALMYFSAKMKWRSIVEFLEKIYPYGMIFIILILATPLGNIMFQPVRWILQAITSQ